MKTLDDPLVTEPPTKGPTTGTAHVTYHVMVCRQERTFTAEATVSGSAAAAAMSLTHAVRDDTLRWLSSQTQRPTAVRVKGGPFGRRRGKVPAERVEPAAGTEYGVVTATVEINGVTHEYTSEVATAGDPYRATAAAVNAAQKDLWNWAWDQDKNR
jgi:hypothetical protein